MAQTKTSKTARRSSPSGPKGEFQADANAPRLTPLGVGDQAGKWAYVRDSRGATLRLRVGSDEMISALAELTSLPAFAPRVLAELAELSVRYPSWAETAAKVNTATEG